MAPYEDPRFTRAGDMPFGRPRGLDLHDAEFASGANCFVGIGATDLRLYTRDDEILLRSSLEAWATCRAYQAAGLGFQH